MICYCGKGDEKFDIVFLPFHLALATIHGSELDASFPQLNYKFNREKRNQLSSSLIYLLSIADPIIDKTAVGWGSLNVRPTSSRLRSDRRCSITLCIVSLLWQVLLSIAFKTTGLKKREEREKKSRKSFPIKFYKLNRKHIISHNIM